MTASAAPARVLVLQPAAWRRAIAPMIVAVMVLSIVLQDPVAQVLPAGTPRPLVFLAIAVSVMAAVVLGLAAAYPKITVGADGVLRVRGRSVRPGELVRVRRSVSRGGGAAYLVLTFDTDAGRRIRVLVAGAPVRGLNIEQLRLLREAAAASAIPTARDSAQERAFLSESVLASGRRVEVDRGLVLRELDELRGVQFGAPAADAVDAAGAESGATAEAAPVAPAPQQEGRFGAARGDDVAAEETLAIAARATRRARRVAVWVFVAACVAASTVLVILVIMEITGTDFGAADEDPMTAAMGILILVAVLAGIAWAIAADVDDARHRAVSQRWLAEASPEQRLRGIPTPFHAAWLRAPGGRMAGFGLFVLGMLALMAVVGGPVALAQGFGPPAVGIVVTIAGALAAGAGLWAWLARRRAHARRVEWLIGVAGEQAAAGPALGDPTTR
ncbi:MAG: hypothetical protein DI534_13720 [Leifsonia xyli]|nr:MAG: hypothetical protein DI534_13720 [Leifsonia xyli]